MRAACKVGDIDWRYLRFVQHKIEDCAEARWRPAAGTFEGWPNAAKELTLLDPCMGSGHFLVFALHIFVAFRMSEEGLSQSAAVDAVLRDNLFGLEIDPRCTQIAAFNLAFAAWRMVGHRRLPRLNLACSGLGIGVTKVEWLKLAEKAVTAADPAAKRDLLGVETNLLTAGIEQRVKNGLEALYDLFAKASWLGSLLDPRRADADIFHEGFEKLEPLLASILAAADTDDAREMAVAAQGMARAAEILGARYWLVATNVPYLIRSKQQQPLIDFFERHYVEAKTDLATCFVDRCLELSREGGSAAVVTQQAMLFLRSYKTQRKRLLTQTSWNFVVRLGPRAFETISGERVDVMLLCVTKTSPEDDSSVALIDVMPEKDAQSKSAAVRKTETKISFQNDQLSNPDSAVKFDSVGAQNLLGRYANCYQGTSPGDGSRLVLNFWELPTSVDGWDFFQGPPGSTSLYRGREQIIHSRSLGEWLRIGRNPWPRSLDQARGRNWADDASAIHPI